jgi:hypothetical protein
MRIKNNVIAIISSLLLLSVAANAQTTSRQQLAQKILTDSRLDTVQARALKLLTAFTAGTSYGEIWIRDFNTFIRGSLKVRDSKDVKDALLLFFKIQGKDNNIPDGAINAKDANVGYAYMYSDLAPGWAIHKNTVETDQESSLIQAVKKYIDVTGDKSILNDKIGGLTVTPRMEAAMTYILTERWSEKFGLVKGATTVDWGDMQAQNGWGVVINDKTKWAIDIYDNAMFVSAINDFLEMKPGNYKTTRNWKKVRSELKGNIRKYLWDAENKKYIPHLYLDGSPFTKDFDENKIFYSGGTTCAILACLHSKSEIKEINNQMLAMAAKEKFATIGMTVYPVYPLAAFPNVPPYTYQNGGDWTWFGGRMIQALVANKMPEEAYAELSPMIERVLKNKGFYEWYDVRDGRAAGSGDFRGEAGVLYDAIQQIKAWASANK